MKKKVREIKNFFKNFSDSLYYFDIGAALPFNNFLRYYKNILTIKLFEPNQIEFSKLKKINYIKKKEVFKSAIGNKKKLKFHIYDSSNLSSVFKLDKRYSSILKKFKLKKKITIYPKKLSNFLNNNHKKTGNTLKIDVQGMALDCLKSAGKKIEYFSVIIVEAEIFKIYKNQNSIGDLDNFLNNKKFINLGSICRFERSIYRKNIKYNFRELNYANNYLYIKNIFTQKLNKIEYINIIFYLFEFKFYDLAEYLINEKLKYSHNQSKLKKLLNNLKKIEKENLNLSIKKLNKKSKSIKNLLSCFDNSKEVFSDFR